MILLTQMVSWIFFLYLISLSFKRWLMALAENLTPVWASNLSASWCLVGLHDLEVLIIKRSRRSVVSSQNQDHDCNLHSIYLNAKLFFFWLNVEFFWNCTCGYSSLKQPKNFMIPSNFHLRLFGTDFLKSLNSYIPFTWNPN